MVFLSREEWLRLGMTVRCVTSSTRRARGAATTSSRTLLCVSHFARALPHASHVHNVDESRVRRAGSLH